MGRLGGIDAPLAITGGNCALSGFDIEGNDVFWTVSIQQRIESIDSEGDNKKS